MILIRVDSQNSGKMRKIIVLLLFLLNYGLWAQDAASVQVITRSLPNKVLLRWAVDQPWAWKRANEVGFWVERATISRNGNALVPIERKQLVSQPLKPKPLEEWEILAKGNQNAAILVQALYGDSFEVTSPGNKMGAVYAINDELEQRFTFALIAAEQNYEASKLAGWALEDSTVIAGERYVYSVSVAFPEENLLPIKNGTAYASPDIYEALPRPIDLAGIFVDGKVTLSWNFNLLQHTYTNYLVERSLDNISFKQLNGVPIFNAQQSKSSMGTSIFYMDSIPNNTTFYYRVKGRTAFGEIGPSSEVIQGVAQANLGFVPRIYKKEFPTDDKVILSWEFKEEGNKLIDKFQLRKSVTNKGPYTTVIDDIPITTRKISFKGLKRVNYFTIVAIGKNGSESESYATLVQPIDSVPPAAPIGLSGVADTTGVVKLNWIENSEEDLGGYRIFRSLDPKIEFSEITKTTCYGEVYSDTVPVANLNKKIYYKLLAEDQRYNRSAFSEVLMIKKPDITPPSPPLLKNYKVDTNGIRIDWVPSSSPDVVSHILYRKNGTDGEMAWEKLFESVSARDSTFFDTKLLDPNPYSYTIIAKDSAGLESLPAKPIGIIWSGGTLKEDDIKFSGIVDRELRLINLIWKIENEQVSEYRLYRGMDNQQLKLYKTLGGTSKGYTDTALEINSDYTYGLQLILNGGRTSSIKKINIKY